MLCVPQGDIYSDIFREFLSYHVQIRGIKCPFLYYEQYNEDCWELMVQLNVVHGELMVELNVVYGELMVELNVVYGELMV